MTLNDTKTTGATGHKPDHPAESGRRGFTMFTLWRLTRLAANLLIVGVIAAVLYSPRTAGTALLFFAVAVLALRIARKRAFLSAWAEVPGAFAHRAISRGDDPAAQQPHRADLIWLGIHTLALIAGALLLANVPAPAQHRGIVLVMVGGAAIGYFVTRAGAALIATHEPWVYRFRVFPMVGYAAWCATGLSVGGDRELVMNVLATAATYGVTIALVAAVCGGLVDRRPRTPPKMALGARHAADLRRSSLRPADDA